MAFKLCTFLSVADIRPFMILILLQSYLRLFTWHFSLWMLLLSWLVHLCCISIILQYLSTMHGYLLHPHKVETRLRCSRQILFLCHCIIYWQLKKKWFVVNLDPVHNIDQKFSWSTVMVALVIHTSSLYNKACYSTKKCVWFINLLLYVLWLLSHVSATIVLVIQ